MSLHSMYTHLRQQRSQQNPLRTAIYVQLVADGVSWQVKISLLYFDNSQAKLKST